MLYTAEVDGILPKGPYLSCLHMADGALLAGYPRGMTEVEQRSDLELEKDTHICLEQVNYGVSVVDIPRKLTMQ